MDIKDLLQAAMNKDAGTFEKTFGEIMNNKMSSAIEAKYESLFDEGYKKKMKEEEDEDEDEDEDEE